MRDFHAKIKVPVGSSLDKIIIRMRKRMNREPFRSGLADAYVHFTDDSNKPDHVRRADALVVLHECNRRSSIQFDNIKVTGSVKDYDFRHDEIEVDIIFKGKK